MQVLHEGAVVSEEVEVAEVSFAEERTHVAVSWQLKGVTQAGGMVQEKHEASAGSGSERRNEDRRRLAPLDLQMQRCFRGNFVRTMP